MRLVVSDNAGEILFVNKSICEMSIQYEHLGLISYQIKDQWQNSIFYRFMPLFPAGALWSVLGQDSLFHIAQSTQLQNGYLSINKAVLRACALYAANCSGISIGD